MFCLSMYADWKTLFVKTATMTEAKERANREFKNCQSFKTAWIYNQEDASEIFKARGGEWTTAPA